MINNSIVTVSQLNTYIKLILEGDKCLKSIFVSGEISNLRNNLQSGHVYFSLKDSRSVIRAVIFSGSLPRVRFELKEGMKVIVRGSVSSYEVSGQYQLYVNDIQPEGIGALYLQLEQLKKRLEEEGLFDNERKRELPKFPKNIGVLTSPSGAVFHDIKCILARRYPLCRIMLFPVRVQGQEASREILEGIKELNDPRNRVDVIIVARGGGAAEELWVFNDEAVVRAVYASAVPVISAIGHETDFTLCDLAADLRAPTPSAAAEMVVPDRKILISELDDISERIKTAGVAAINKCSLSTNIAVKGLLSCLPSFMMKRDIERISDIEKRLMEFIRSIILSKSVKFKELLRAIKALCPSRILLKGYALIYLYGNSIKSAKELKDGETVKAIFADGAVEFGIVNLRRL